MDKNDRWREGLQGYLAKRINGAIGDFAEEIYRTEFFEEGGKTFIRVFYRAFGKDQSSVFSKTLKAIYWDDSSYY